MNDIAKNLLIILLLLSWTSSFAQRLSKEQVRDTIDILPSFSIYKNNYFITGIPLHQGISKSTADAKYQISFKQLLTRATLPLDSYLYLTYTQKALWTVYQKSSPFEEINFNPGIGLGKPVFNRKGKLIGMAYLKAEHESNGRDSIYSRSWNNISLSFHTRFSERTSLSTKIWFPFRYKNDNPDILDYIGLGQLNLHHEIKQDKLSLALMLQKGLNWEWKGAVRTRLLYRPFNMKNQYLMLEWYHGYAESLITYNEHVSMIRFGFVISANPLNFITAAD